MKREQGQNWTTKMGDRWGKMFALCFALTLFAATAFADVRVIDGDTFVLDGEKVRVENIDAPEIRPCRCQAECDLGYRAKAFTERFLVGEIVLERIPRRDRYGRTLARVRVGDVDLGEALIAAGLARPWEGRRRPWC